ESYLVVADIVASKQQLLLCRGYQARFLGGFVFARYINPPVRECVHSSPPAGDPKQFEPLNLLGNGGIDQQLLQLPLIACHGLFPACVLASRMRVGSLGGTKFMMRPANAMFAIPCSNFPVGETRPRSLQELWE